MCPGGLSWIQSISSRACCPLATPSEDSMQVLFQYFCLQLDQATTLYLLDGLKCV